VPDQAKDVAALARSGQNEAALDKYAEILQEAPQRGLTKAEFDVVVGLYCDQAETLAQRALAETGTSPRERQAHLNALRGKVAHCPDRLRTIEALGEAIEQVATAGWDAEVAPLEARGDLPGAWAAAKAWVAGLDQGRALWRRYEALTKRLRERYQAAAKAAGTQRPYAAWLYGTLAHQLGDEAAPPARPQAEWGYTVVDSEAGATAGVDPRCAGLERAMAPSRAGDSGPNPVRVGVTLTGCSPGASDADETGYEVQQVMGPVEVTEQVCHEEQTPVLHTATQKVCNQFGENCYSYLVGGYVMEPRTVCADVTRTVQQLHEERVPYDAVRPGTAVHVGYAVMVEVNGETERLEDHAAHTVSAPDLLRKPADAQSLAAARPSFESALAGASRDLADAVSRSVAIAVQRRVAAQHEQVAARSEAAGDLDAAREQRLVLATAPDARASDAAWDWIAQREGLPKDTLQGLVGGSLHPETPSWFSVNPWFYNRHNIRAESQYAVLRYGVPPLSTRVFGQFVAFDHIPTQPDRQGVFTTAGGSLSPALQIRDDGFGFGYQDDLDFQLMIGGRISDAYQYPGPTQKGEEKETIFGIGYLGAYTAMVGYRGELFGLFAGARAQYSGLRVGDARTAGAAFPLVAQLEVRFRDDLPLIARAWGSDLFGTGDTARSLGASLELPVALNVALYGRFERRHLETQFGGLNKKDFVTAGRTTTTVAGAGVSLSLQ
jgi:hypothetical protein